MAIDRLADLVGGGDVTVLSGAGLSTESGIPDYRGPDGVQRRGAPMTYQTFTREAFARRRYWARSHLGWRSIARASPNDGHRAVAALQERGLLAGIVTQNVDGLHRAAGADEVVELHGSLDRVVCLGCGELSTRQRLHRRLDTANPGYTAQITAIHPDGDVELTDDEVAGFATVDCEGCGGMLKPDVVFFGETVPAVRVQHCFDLVERSRLLLVLGSSLTVMSGRRFVIRAAKHGIPVAIVNRGATRSDDTATLRLDAPLGTVLPTLLTHLPRPSTTPV
ncbi:NAD-dependent protein deacetylase [Catellatospora sp. TT07R-123]|nr:NAD-dependent protein deacetylase [Catellatospora sp. TT07R-123]GHJ48387.1 NAD-dependent protein deacetylase [Catellatospora sp. TT07R-123]